MMVGKTREAGSPPRMRGKPLKRVPALRRKGITPADAGKTIDAIALALYERDHPRGCGENISKAVDFGGERGSPPRMRGKLNVFRIRRGQKRITPADAGKTAASTVTLLIYGDHPRGCGENIVLWRPAVARRGSPPRMRGKHGTYG